LGGLRGGVQNLERLEQPVHPVFEGAGLAKIEDTLMSFKAVVLPRSISRSRKASNEP